MSDAASLVEVIENRDQAGLPLVVEKHRKQAKKKVVPKLMKVAGKIPFSEELAASYFCALDPMTPARVKGVLFASLAYFVMPVDMVPDVIAALGFTDDATVLATALGIVGAHVRPRHQKAARNLLGRKDPPGETEG